MTGCEYAATLNPLQAVWVHETCNGNELGWYCLYAGTIVSFEMYTDVEFNNISVDSKGEIVIEVEYQY